MACGDCKDDKWKISLKLNQEQKANESVHLKIRSFLAKTAPGLSFDRIDQIVEFAKICKTSVILEDKRDIVMNLASLCFENGIPVEVRSLTYSK